MDEIQNFGFVAQLQDFWAQVESVLNTGSSSRSHLNCWGVGLPV